MLLDLTSTSHSHFYETNVLLVSPDFFSLQNLDALHRINPQRAIMVLLGTSASDIQTFLSQKYPAMLKITFFETQATEDCVRALLIGIIKLYEHVHEASDEETEKDVYDKLPLPRKSPGASINNIHKVAVSFDNNNREVFILCDRKGSDEIQIELLNRHGQIKAIHENKAIYRFSVDAELAKTNPKFIAKDGQLTIGSGQVVIPESQCVKPESQNKPTRSKLDILQDILGEEKDPVCLMCQALNIEERTREALDMNLARKCQSLEPLRKFDGGLFDNIGRRSSGHSNEKWPTLIHFAAEFNLPRFCEELLKLPWSEDACYKMNKDDDTPLDIAKRKSFHELVEKLEICTAKTTKSGNVPGNKDSGVVEDEIPMKDDRLSSSESYTDMSEMTKRGSFTEKEETPPPSPHPPPTTPPPPKPHRPQSKSSGDSYTQSEYMDMNALGTTQSAPNLPSIQVQHAPTGRSLSDSQSQNYADDEEEDEEYDYPIEFDLQSTGSSTSNLTYLSPQPVIHEDVQLPTHSHGERHSGFFKKFKLFGKKHKKDPKPPSRDRKMSLPTEMDLKAFQQTRAGGRRGSIPAVQVNRDSSSSTSSGEINVMHTREDKSKSVDLFQDANRRKKKTHFLNKDTRKSMRMNKAIEDKINPLPLPQKSKHK
ncbi:BCAP [Mytilus edulis]|uniref:PIK3AP1 n=1 Tax=Mytilus edulis TaxID=6550 RepID=A0A8S3SKH3_MYTED|nr:BCAP [Mytilus edulis]